METITFHYNRFGKREISNGNSEIYSAFSSFRKNMIEKYSGKKVDVRILCWNSTPEEIVGLKREKGRLIERIASECKIPVRSSCGGCLGLCEEEL